ncbi:MAG TPA: transglycosylase SLT domain-containing protein [Pyrinomonadaceae bacterium]|nr:transglycosylase SLT domain-containing protein [Pyrinomonadaceae bacterium]
MKTYLFKVFSFTAILTFVLNSFVSAQVTSTTSDGRNNTKPVQAEQAEARIQQVTSDSGRYFKQGLLNLQDNRRPQARDDFDKSVEVFLMSGINLTSNNNAKSRDCYNQLIETVYRMEFPTQAQVPQIRALSATCGWTIDNDLADKVAKLVLTAPIQQTPANNNSLIASALPNVNQSNDATTGFTEQKFEPSPLDDLAKLELTTDEQQVENNPLAQQQYQLVQVAVANKSLGFTFQVHPMIQQYLNYYQGRGRSTMETGLYRSGMFMRMARRIFREEGIPENVAWLGQVESMWKPTAMSWAAASGLWQFIPGTGSRFGLRKTAYVDERNSFEGATRASARYLKFLANRYGGNWELAMAAYNSGEGNVDRAIARAGASNFWVAYPYLPKETRNYVPNILATILIANNPQQYGFGQVRPAPQLVYDTVRVPSSTSLALLAQASDTTVEYIRYLNPELRTNMTPPEAYNVRVPPGKGNEVVAIFKRMPNTKVVNNSALATSVTGETWQNISNRTGISVADLMAANPGMKSPTGKVIIPFGNNVRNTSYQRPTNQPQTVPTTGGVRVVKALSGDTVAKVAERYGANAVDVANLNGMTSINAALAAGREVKIPVN